MMRLPREALLHIVALLPSVSDVNSLALVNKTLLRSLESTLCTWPCERPLLDEAYIEPLSGEEARPSMALAGAAVALVLAVVRNHARAAAALLAVTSHSSDVLDFCVESATRFAKAPVLKTLLEAEGVDLVRY
ncbi:hypothetical protein V2A60_005771 [Cordyceps javanica]